MGTLIAPTNLERNDISQESRVPEKGDVSSLMWVNSLSSQTSDHCLGIWASPVTQR